MKTVIIGIAGGTGSGKSSGVNLIPRFYDATRGEVLVDGKNVRDYTLEELRAKVGVVLQKAVLFKGTIRENLSWGNSDATDEEMYEALETAQAREFVDAKEGGLSYDRAGRQKPFWRTETAPYDCACAREEAGDSHYGRQCIRA